MPRGRVSRVCFCFETEASSTLHFSSHGSASKDMIQAKATSGSMKAHNLIGPRFYHTSVSWFIFCVYIYNSTWDWSGFKQWETAMWQKDKSVCLCFESQSMKHYTSLKFLISCSANPLAFKGMGCWAGWKFMIYLFILF